MRVRQARDKLESSSSGCQTISLTSSACGQRSQSRGFEDRFLSSDRLASPSGASWFLASALLRFLSSPARFSSPTAVPPSSFEGHVSLRWLTLPHSAISSATTSLRTSWALGSKLLGAPMLALSVEANRDRQGWRGPALWASLVSELRHWGGGWSYDLDACGRLGRRDERTQVALRCISRSLVSATAVYHRASRWRRPTAGRCGSFHPS